MKLPRAALTGFAVAGALAVQMAMAPMVMAAGDSDGETGENAAVPDPTKAASNPLSDAGTSGFHLYKRHCQDCHGYLGVGSEKGVPLASTKYAKEHKARRAFHKNFRHSTPKHARVALGTRKKPGPRFNELELIAKFLREIEAWHAMLKKSNVD